MEPVSAPVLLDSAYNTSTKAKMQIKRQDKTWLEEKTEAK
jgi:hypothetical protein